MTYVSREFGEHAYRTTIAQEPAGLGATRANLSRLLRTLDFVGWSTNEESGRLDRRALTRYATGSANIFSRRELKESEKTAVSVLIDCSGSMDGCRIKTAQSVAIHLSKILNQAKVPFAVTGFHRDRRRKIVAGDNALYSSSPTFIPFKRWGESLPKAVAKLGNIDQFAHSGTPDYSALYLTIEEISRREENRKIVFLLTDAEGYARSHMRHLQKFADSQGVTIIAIGIGLTDVQSCFANAENVMDVSDLASATFNRLLKTLGRKIK